jgi:hypothetical protein
MDCDGLCSIVPLAFKGFFEVKRSRVGQRVGPRRERQEREVHSIPARNDEI